MTQLKNKNRVSIVTRQLQLFQQDSFANFVKINSQEYSPSVSSALCGTNFCEFKDETKKPLTRSSCKNTVTGKNYFL